MDQGWTIDIDAVGDPADTDDRYEEQLLAFDKILVTPSALEHLAERMNRE